MTVTVLPGSRSGLVNAVPSKSAAHRLLIAAALSETPAELVIPESSADIDATKRCLSALLEKAEPCCPNAADKADYIDLYPGESGSTLRFLLPVAGALGKNCIFHLEGRLPERPIEPLASELTAHGMQLEKAGNKGELLKVSGKLRSGDYCIPGNISSQYVTGLLYALPLLEGNSVLNVKGPVESANYIEMTEQTLRRAGIAFERIDGTDADGGRIYKINGGQRYELHGTVEVEGDWSGAAFFLAMGALSEEGVTVSGLAADTLQGDAEILEILARFGADISRENGTVTVKRGALKGIDIDASGIPDLVPVLSAVACAADGTTRITGAARLRLKESDRLQTTRELLQKLGANVTETADGLIIEGHSIHPFTGGCVNSSGDHRIAMTAAVCAAAADGPVTVEGAEAVAKSYPDFWNVLRGLNRAEEQQ